MSVQEVLDIVAGWTDAERAALLALLEIGYRFEGGSSFRSSTSGVPESQPSIASE
jgi:hypothetical protein